jgi:hypothetical protein
VLVIRRAVELRLDHVHHVVAAPSKSWLVMMPSTVMTAILFWDSLFSKRHSSSLGPDLAGAGEIAKQT